jgi:precorrin-6Y C5,15-methyltransferase (decarboxylating)
LPDESFEQRRPLRGQITKREVRAVALYSLGIRVDGTIWDIGAGTGSISVEAGLLAPQGRVFAIERDEDSIGLLRSNVARLGTPNVEVVVGEAPRVLNGLPDPDSVFIGGSGGQLSEMLDLVAQRLRPGGRIVVNLAVLERTQEVYRNLKDKAMEVDLVMVNASRGREMPDGAVRLEALNPVFIVTATREEARL